MTDHLEGTATRQRPDGATATAGQTPPSLPGILPREVREALLARREIVLADLREEDPYAKGHPLWAANFPLGRLEEDAPRRIPRADVTIVLYGHDGHRDLTLPAARRLQAMGYRDLRVLSGGLEAWIAAGYESFIDVNVPSKAFGELVEARAHTPLLDAEDVARLLASDQPPVVLDARRFDEYATMSIPGGISVPGAELVLRARDLAPDPDTRIIVNCAGRTRSIIGTQSLINAGLPNPVAGLRNGTIGWTLAGLVLETGADRRFETTATTDASRALARRDARAVAERAGVERIPLAQARELAHRLARAGRTLYRVDVRSAPEYLAGHLPGFLHMPGGQLVQETDHVLPVRGAQVLLADDDGVRADMTGSWLAQMGWDVLVIEPVLWAMSGAVSGPGADGPAAPDAGSGAGLDADLDTDLDTGHDLPYAHRPKALQTPTLQVPGSFGIGPHQLAEWLASRDTRTVVIDLAPSARHIAGHLPGAWFALRSQLAQALTVIGPADRYVVSAPSDRLAAFGAQDLAALVDVPVHLLTGGLEAWQAAGFPSETGETHLASPRIDRYRRPYEGTDAPHSAMQAYLDWEYGLVAQLDRDATHFFRPI